MDDADNKQTESDTTAGTESTDETPVEQTTSAAPAPVETSEAATPETTSPADAAAEQPEATAGDVTTTEGESADKPTEAPVDTSQTVTEDKPEETPAPAETASEAASESSDDTQTTEAPAETATTETPATEPVPATPEKVDASQTKPDPAAPVKTSKKKAAVATEAKAETVTDTVSKKAPAAPEAVKNEAAPAVTKSAATVADGDDENVATLKIQLAAFAKANNAKGKSPEDFKASAKLASSITKHVIAHPKEPVLNALLVFFVENKNGVCKNENYMKGSTTLDPISEQQVGYLYNLFADLANKRVVSVNMTAVVNTLKKVEIYQYYTRRVNAIKAAKA